MILLQVLLGLPHTRRQDRVYLIVEPRDRRPVRSRNQVRKDLKHLLLLFEMLSAIHVTFTVYSIFFSTLLPTTNANFPQTPDSYMVCGGDVPQSNTWGPFPPGYSPDDYRDNLDLCSVAYGKVNADGSPRNVGCRCYYSGQSTPGCPRVFADQTLSTWQGLWHGWDFPRLCAERLCACTDNETAAGYRNAGQLGNAVFDYVSVLNHKPSGVYPYLPGAESSEEEEDATSDPGSGDYFNISSSVGDTCGATCTSNSQCSLGSAPVNTTSTLSCSCQVQSSTLIPGNVGTAYANVVHAAACIISGLGKKRDEPDLCPCNTTYVSEACCNSRNGMVWELPEMYRGRLQQTDDL